MILSLFFLLLVLPDPVTAGTLNVHFLDVGQGLAIYAECDGETLVYDGGGRSSSSYVVSYLQQMDVEKIDYLICSHYDEDHMAGLIGCLHAFDTGTVFGPDYERDTELYQSFINCICEKNLEFIHPEEGTFYELGSSYFMFLGPLSISEDDNDNSLVVLLENAEDSFLFTGDAGYEEEYSILRSGIPVESSVYCAGHHGSHTSSSPAFLDAVQPDTVVISCGLDNSYGHPHKETLELFLQRDIGIYRTDLQGTITASTNGTGIEWNTELCRDYFGGYELSTDNDADTTVSAESEAVMKSGKGSYFILNTSRMRIHEPDCDSVKEMKEHNKQEYWGTVEELLELGYRPCGACNPS